LLEHAVTGRILDEHVLWQLEQKIVDVCFMQACPSKVDEQKMHTNNRGIPIGQVGVFDFVTDIILRDIQVEYFIGQNFIREAQKLCHSAQ